MNKLFVEGHNVDACTCEFYFNQRMPFFCVHRGKKVVPCRFDWHQTGSQVIMSIYAKNAVPELSSVEGNSTVVRHQGHSVGLCVI